MPDYFRDFVGTTREYAKRAVADYRGVLVRVYLVWVNESVLGIYDDPDKARDQLRMVLRTPGFTKAAWTNVGTDHWIGYLEDGSKIVVRVDGRVVG